ncbi:hypothetical protein NC652_010762 [Populus alba x Populus x berolinensis]|nr:hypothetical protein NC652_010762 [Populus alba x Populus x berolinensis]
MDWTLASRPWMIDASRFHIANNECSSCTLPSEFFSCFHRIIIDQVKVMLLGHDDECLKDKNMKATLALNHFGPICKQRMPT